MKEQMGLRGFYHRTMENMPRVSDKLPELPRMVFDILQQTQTSLKQLSTPAEEPKPKKKKYRFALGSGVILTTLGVIYSFNKDLTPIVKLQDFISYHSTAFMVVGVGCLIYYVLKKER